MLLAEQLQMQQKVNRRNQLKEQVLNTVPYEIMDSIINGSIRANSNLEMTSDYQLAMRKQEQSASTLHKRRHSQVPKD